MVPQDVITDILSRLSVKVLIRFKSVCKRWKDWIESPEFVTLHYNKMSTKRKSLILNRPCRPVVSTVSSDNLEVSSYVEFPFFEDEESCPVLCFCGPCNGLWCLYGRTTGNDDGYSSIVNNIALWNPATRELKALPKSCTRGPDLQDDCLLVNVGFGYDRNTKDYKVIKISEFYNYTFRQRDSWVEVYSLSNDHWRDIEATVPISRRGIRGIRDTTYPNSTSLEGIPYWLSNSVILSFNTSDEVFETIELPLLQGNPLRLHVLHNSLALVVFSYPSYEQGERYEVWKLRENNGEVKSWTKVSTIRGPSNFLSLWFSGFFDDGIAVIKDFYTLMLYNLETHETKIKRPRNYDEDDDNRYLLSEIFVMYSYVESLVSVEGGGRLTTPSSSHKLACYNDILPLED